MSEPNKTRTIPLHIADQAVAACEAEIQKLKEENARLNYQVSNLMLQVNSPHPAVMRWSLACKERDAFDKKLREAEAKIERLLEAGNEMAEHVGREWAPSWVVQDWNAAKEGKPSA